MRYYACHGPPSVRPPSRHGALPAQTIIRLGTLVPKGSRWHEILLNMGEEWKKASGGKIELQDLSRRRAGRRARNGPEASHQEAASRRAFGRRPQRHRRRGLRAANPHDAWILGRAGLRPRPHFRPPGKRSRAARVHRPELGRRRFGPLFHQEAGLPSRRNPPHEAVRSAGRQQPPSSFTRSTVFIPLPWPPPIFSPACKPGSSKRSNRRR